MLHFVSDIIDFFARHLWGNYGIALLIVTVIVRLLVLPLMVKQIRVSKMMQQMQPELQKIRAKYKGDTQKIQQETMKLYQEAGINPMAGCLPMLIQLPILYALFGAIEGNVGLYHYTFLSIFYLGKPDHYYILPLLAAVTTYLSSRVTMSGSDPQQRMMLLIMPVFIFLLGSRFPAGLALYWIYSNIFTTVQTYFIRVRPMQREQAASGK
ncbi:YidC/Oxa1 family membrane protein insertase [Alicyclobacillus contaminans]|uniref:YidC/Oxa1 family membrane protein insertase n=1 Tax=Alicyclobacillus contaminans TaxID=392016 RepID=UPI0006879F29|nr:YidC/Oxa1 family membrane protein insertase [Alicyclobacillus contaminans]